MNTTLPGTPQTLPLWSALEVLQGARCAGYADAALLDRLGVPAAARGDAQRAVPIPVFSAALRRLSRELRDEFFGLGRQPVPPGTLALVMRQLLPCATLGEALPLGLRLYRLIHPPLPLRLRLDGDTARLEVRGAADDDRAFACMLLYGALSIARWLVGEMLPLRWAHMASPAQDPRWPADEPFFGAPTTYGQALPAIGFDAAWLHKPVVQGRDTLAAFLRAAPGNVMRPHAARPSVIDRVQLCLRQCPPEQPPPSLPALAQSLGVSPRSLRRRLQDQGLSYRHLKDEARRDIALEWLARSDLPLTEIGERLGFSDPSTFHRAFRRWTGSAPGAFRRGAAAAGAAQAGITS